MNALLKKAIYFTITVFLLISCTVDKHTNEPDYYTKVVSIDGSSSFSSLDRYDKKTIYKNQIAGVIGLDTTNPKYDSSVNYLTDNCYNQEVRLISYNAQYKDSPYYDSDGNQVYRVMIFCKNGDAGADMLKNGLTTVDTSVDIDPSYTQLEQDAKTNKRGIWANN